MDWVGTGPVETVLEGTLEYEAIRLEDKTSGEETF
jgi:hypothetical protein